MFEFPIRVRSLPPALHGMAWMVASGIAFALLNTLLRLIALTMPPLEVQFLRYFCGLVVMLPFILRAGIMSYRPHNIKGQFWRGAVHAAGMVLWYIALPKLSLADTTAIGFTGPLFVMIGAVIFFKERMIWERWFSALVGFAGVLIVVAPNLGSGDTIYYATMLASSPLFAASALIVKSLTRRDRTEVIVVWQCITIALFTLPLAIPTWEWPTATQWAIYLGTGVLGTVAHFCGTNALRVADVTATQGFRFLDLIWTTILGLIVFSDRPSIFTFVGGIVIATVTAWLARREKARL